MAPTMEWQRAVRWMQRRVTHHDDAMRVDRWLRQYFPHVSQSFLQRQLRLRKIRVVAPDESTSVPAKPNAILYAGAVVAIDAVVFEHALRQEPVGSDPVDTDQAAEFDGGDMVARLVQRVVYKDDNFLVLNKPHGLAVQDGTALTHSLATYLPTLGVALDSEPPRLVHRLDKETSGLLVLARHRLAAARFSEILRDGGVAKTYDALVTPLRHAPDIPSSGEISLPVDGKPARSLFRRLRVADDARSLWLEMQPVTGRKHQLRVHCALGLQAPIVGDRRHGPMMKAVATERLWLHAKRVLFADPFRPNRLIDVACEMDDRPSDSVWSEEKPQQNTKRTATVNASKKNL